MLCLNMIVKNEADVIERCLASVKPYIDSWCIVDTGSSDGTQAIIRNALSDLPGELHERPWKDFGHNRTEALELARDKAEYLLFIDADEVLVGKALPALTAQAYAIPVRYGEFSYDRTCIVRTDLPWRWDGVLHEYLEVGQPFTKARIEDFEIVVRQDGARSKDPEKFQKDAAILEHALRNDPNNARIVFYFAQSLRDAGDLRRAYECYERRSNMGGWDEEVWYAKYEMGRLTERMGDSPERVRSLYLDAFQFRPTRAEPLYELARYHRGRAEWALAYLFAKAAAAIPRPNDILFLDESVYRWRVLDELGIAGFWAGHKEDGRAALKRILLEDLAPRSERERMENNLWFYREAA